MWLQIKLSVVESYSSNQLIAVWFLKHTKIQKTQTCSKRRQIIQIIQIHFREKCWSRMKQNSRKQQKLIFKPNRINLSNLSNLRGTISIYFNSMQDWCFANFLQTSPSHFGVSYFFYFFAWLRTFAWMSNNVK